MNSRLPVIVAILALPLNSEAAVPQHDEYEHLGVQSCGASSCHGSAGARDTYSVLQNEYITWARHDLHARAYSVLRNEQSKRIAANLGLEAAHTAELCLDCHSDYVPRGRRGLQFRLSDGVACEACHGGAEKWLGIHIGGGGDKHAESLAAGLYPTEDPVARAELCLSCHLGTQDKFVTHEIMGAGHPRLSFDLQKFTDLQPRHYRVDDDYRQRKAYVEDTRVWAIGQVLAARQYLTLLQGPLVTTGGLFPELALFDCHGCHHSFKDLRWQPDENSPAPPGTVLLNDSSLAMTRIVAEVVQPGLSGVLLSEIRGLHQAARTDTAALRTAAAKVDGQLARLSASLMEQRFGPQRNEQMIEALASAVAGRRFADYSDAEQATMALDVYSGVTGEYRNEVDALYEAVADAAPDKVRRFDPAVFAAAFSRRIMPEAPVRSAPPATAPAQRAGPRAEPIVRQTVNATGLRVRSAPDAGAEVRDMLYSGNEVQLLNSTGEWSQVTYDDAWGVTQTGWVASRFLDPQ